MTNGRRGGTTCKTTLVRWRWHRGAWPPSAVRPMGSARRTAPSPAVVSRCRSSNETTNVTGLVDGHFLRGLRADKTLRRSDLSRPPAIDFGGGDGGALPTRRAHTTHETRSLSPPICPREVRSEFFFFLMRFTLSLARSALSLPRAFLSPTLNATEHHNSLFEYFFILFFFYSVLFSIRKCESSSSPPSPPPLQNTKVSIPTYFLCLP